MTDDRRETTLDKVRKLINLAASPNLQEAQHAAYKACALIRDLGLDVCNPDEIDAVYESLADAQAQVRQLERGRPRSSEDPDPFRQRAGFSGVVPPGQWGSPSYSTASPPPFSTSRTPPGSRPSPSTSSSATSPRTASPGAGANQTPFSGSVSPPVTDPPMVNPVRLRGGSRFDTECKQCRKKLVTGSDVLWLKGQGVWCATSTCYQDWVNKTNALRNFDPFV